MPVLTDEMGEFTQGNFGFSGTRIDKLRASEYTLASIVVDRSGSLLGFDGAVEKVLQSIVAASRKNPRADNMMIRVTYFNSHLEEQHGFKLLPNINLDDYQGTVKPSGSTALFDAVAEAVQATTTYAQELNKQDLDVNGILIIITDGQDSGSYGGSVQTPAEVKRLLNLSVAGESLESIVSLLIGINTDARSAQALADFSREAALTSFIDAGDATPTNLARIVNFASKSLNSQSQSLGTGGPSQNLPTF